METKELKSAEDRKAAFEGAGIDLSKPITTSCQGGVAAAVVFASLNDISSGQLSVYDGSWAEYSRFK
jgi:thiosulfate/3-mercaptopyruvate sulfurtransferase